MARKSRYEIPAAALASASASADADASQEPAPGHCPERGNTTPERVVEQAGRAQLALG
jgi:hypothetical protein